LWAFCIDPLRKVEENGHENVEDVARPNRPGSIAGVCKGPAVSEDSGWRELLERVSADVVQAGAFEDEPSAEAVGRRWLGSDGAPEEEVAAAESRLGIELPPTYRAFLSTTNGFGPVGFFVRRLRPVEELVWLRDEDPELIAIWTEETQESELAETLAVSDEYDGARVLLNPAIVDENGEWEAWFFAHWVPGAERHSSFWTLVEATHRSFVEQLRAERGEPTPRVAPSLEIDAEDRDGLIDALRRPRAEDRVEALRGLANLRDPAAVPAVIAILLNADEDDYVRQTAARSLGQLRDTRSADALIEILRLPYPGGPLPAPERGTPAHEAVLGLKHAARQGLLQLGELAEPALAAALRDPNPLARSEVCRTLCYARTRAVAAFDLIAPLRTDPDPDVRMALVTHIEQLPDARKRELLLEARRDPVERVRARAAEALALLAEYEHE
jgi:HEAT repeat protein